MMHAAKIVALPVGELEAELVKHEFESLCQSIAGTGAQLVVADPVLDVDTARQSVLELSKETPDLLLIVPLRGLSAQIIEAAVLASAAPCLICPLQGRFALPSSALAIGALRHSKVPVELLYAPPDNTVFLARLNCFLRAARGFSHIRHSRIGVIGGLFPNLVSCRYDAQTVSSRLGTTLLPISYDEIRASIQLAVQRHAESEPARQALIDSYAIKTEDQAALAAGLPLHLALQHFAREQKLDGFATECWSGLPRELGSNPCLGFVEDAYTLACEGDVMLCVSLLLVRYMTGVNAYAGDLYDLDLDGVLTLVHCGAPASLAASQGQVVLSRSKLALERGFETITCRPQMPAGPVTVFRFYGPDCDQLHMAAGDLLESTLSPDLSVKVRIRGNRWDFLEQCFGNHYVVAPGDVRSELKLLGKWLGITISET